MILLKKRFCIQRFSSVVQCVVVWDRAAHGSVSHDKQHGLKSANGLASQTLLLGLPWDVRKRKMTP